MQQAGFAIEKRIAFSVLRHEFLQFLRTRRDHHIRIFTFAQQHAGKFHGPCLHAFSKDFIVGPVQLKGFSFLTTLSIQWARRR